MMIVLVWVWLYWVCVLCMLVIGVRFIFRCLLVKLNCFLVVVLLVCVVDSDLMFISMLKYVVEVCMIRLLLVEFRVKFVVLFSLCCDCRLVNCD